MKGSARLGHLEAIGIPCVRTIGLTKSASESGSAQPYAVVTGHLLSLIAGAAALACLGPGDAAAVLGVGAAASLMRDFVPYIHRPV
jgi:CBS-domain-containing membrane protein